MEQNTEVQSFSCLLLLKLVSKQVGENVSHPVRIPFWNNQDRNFSAKKKQWRRVTLSETDAYSWSGNDLLCYLSHDSTFFMQVTFSGKSKWSSLLRQIDNFYDLNIPRHIAASHLEAFLHQMICYRLLNPIVWNHMWLRYVEIRVFTWSF